MALRVVFFGTPAFAVPSLSALLASPHSVAAVVTQPDRPRGRGHKVRAEAVKTLALERGLEILQPERPADEAFLAAFRSLAPDLGVVAAYGRILPARLLDLPRLGFINVHASLLPRWRGAAPVHRAILAGDHETGITIMRVVPALDAGPVLIQDNVGIGPNETSAELETRLAILGARALVPAVDRLAGVVDSLAEVSPDDLPGGIPQDARQATYAPRLERRESQVDWARPAADVHNQIRGLQPWPLAAGLLRGRRVLFLRSEIARHDSTAGRPGAVSAIERDGIVITTRPGAVRLLTLQLEGREALPAREFLNGWPLAVGDRFDPLPLT